MLEDGQAINSPLASQPSKRAVSEDSSDLDSADNGNWLKVLPKRVSRSKKVAIAGAEGREKRSFSAE